MIATLDADDSRAGWLRILFAPTGPIQEVSLSSGWAYEFLRSPNVRSGRGASLRPGHLVAAAPQPTADSRLTRPAGSGRGPPRRFPEHPGRIGGAAAIGWLVGARDASTSSFLSAFGYRDVVSGLQFPSSSAGSGPHAPRGGPLFACRRALPLREEFAAALAEGTTLALAVNTEKARSEFIIAPLLLSNCGDRWGSRRPLLRGGANRRSGSGPRRRMRFHHHQVGEAIRAHRSADRDRRSEE